MKKTISKNTLVINKMIAKYTSHDGYTTTEDMTQVKTVEKAYEVYDRLQNLIQEIADNGTEGTRLTGLFYQIIMDGLKEITGLDVEDYFLRTYVNN